MGGSQSAEAPEAPEEGGKSPAKATAPASGGAAAEPAATPPAAPAPATGGSEKPKKEAPAGSEKPKKEAPAGAYRPGQVFPAQGQASAGSGGEKGKKKAPTGAYKPGQVFPGQAQAPAQAAGGDKPKKKAPTGFQICVRNLSKDAKEDDLRKQFKGFGKITDVALKTLPNGEGKGYGFVTFSTEEEAKKAIEAMHEKPQAEGKPLLVTMGTRQPGEGKGKGKDGGGEKGEKGKGKGFQICVRNLAKGAKEDDLRKQFKGFGKITDVSVKTLPSGEGKGYGFITFSTADEAKKAIKGMHEKPQSEGKPLLVTMGNRQPGEGKGKGKDGGGEKGGEKGEGKGAKGGDKGKGPAEQPQPPAPNAYQYPYGYQPYSQEQMQAAVRYQQYQQAAALQAQAYYRGFPGVIPGELPFLAPSPPAGGGVIPDQAQAYYARGFPGGVIPNEAQGYYARGFPTSGIPNEAPAAYYKGFPGAAPEADAATKKEQNSAAAPASDKEYIGQVKSISSKNGYGFITCGETKAAYGRDVFVDATLLPDIEVNAKVRFTMELSAKGHPRASKVIKIGDAQEIQLQGR